MLVRTTRTREKLIRARILMLALADELENIRRACKVAGIRRSHHYEIKEAFENAQQAGRLSHRLRTLVFPSLMIIDEIGYLPISRTGAMRFFQLKSRRYEHASTVLTSNKGFEEWREVLGDDVLAAALIDRLVDHCHIVNIRGNTYRMREHRALATRLATAPVNPPSPRAPPAEPTGGLSAFVLGCPPSECALSVGESVQFRSALTDAAFSPHHAAKPA